MARWSSGRRRVAFGRPAEGPAWRLLTALACGILVFQLLLWGLWLVPALTWAPPTPPHLTPAVEYRPERLYAVPPALPVQPVHPRPPERAAP